MDVFELIPVTEQEQPTPLCDVTHSFRYKMNRSGMPWLNYHAGARLYPISDTNRILAVWTADWMAAQNDDMKLVPMVHQDVFQKAFDTIDARFFGSNSPTY